MFAPSQAAVETVKFWLTGAGLPADNITLSANKQWIQFDAEADMACELFKTEFFEYEHLGSGTKMIAVDEYSLPRHVRPHVDYITPGIKLRAHPGNGKATRRRQSPQTPSKRDFKAQNTGPHLSVKADIAADSIPSLNLTACDEYLTAACIRAQYNIPNNTLSSPGNELGVFEGLDEHYSREDLDAFFAGLHPYIPQGTYPISRLIDGAIGAVEDVPGYNQSDAGTEADADLEVAWPLIWPQKTVLFQTDDEFYEVNQTSADTPYLGFWNTFFDAIDGSYCTYSAYNETGDCTTPDCLDPVYPDPGPGGYQGNLQCGVYQPTNVISISYTGGEVSDFSGFFSLNFSHFPPFLLIFILQADLPASYVKRQCDEIMKLALQGVTVVQSSGDTGVASYPHLGMDNGCAGPNNTVFYPSADVTCPYVLAVGANQLNQLEANNASETTFYESSTDYSGGGFSNYFAAPEWQKSAITEYFEKVDLNFTGYQEAGTNFSDVGSGVYNLNGRGYPDVSAVGENYVFFRHGGWGLASGTSISAPIWAAVLTLVNELRLAANKSTVGFVHPVLVRIIPRKSSNQVTRN